MAAITVKPSDGGQLVTRASASDAGVAHYTRKLNWRRDLSDEITREGFDYFLPFGTDASDYQTHPFPDGVSTRDLNLVCLLRRPNGDAALIAGTSTKLYRFNNELSSYIVDENGYIDDGYFEDDTRWRVIGSGFSNGGRRWEVEQLDGTAVFDNGIDIPQAYRCEWRFTKPLYELRDQGIATTGTIIEYNGLLIHGDVREFSLSAGDAVLNVVESGSITLSQAGYKKLTGTSTGTTVTASSGTFSPSDAGRLVVWQNGTKQRISTYTDPTHVVVVSGAAVAAALPFIVTDAIGDTSKAAFEIVATSPWFDSSFVGTTIAFATGETRKIVEYVSTTIVRTDIDIPVASSTAIRENPYAYLNYDDLISTANLKVSSFDRRKYRALWGEIGQATRYGTLVPVEFDAGSFVIRTHRACRSFSVGEQVGIVGGGINGGTLGPVEIVEIGPGRIRLSGAVKVAGSGGMIRYDSIGSTAGYADLQDDGSGILKGKRLQERVVIFKEKNIFIGRYTGNAKAPLEFSRVVTPHGRDLHFRHSVVNIEDSQLVYCGKTDILTFDLTTRRPTVLASGDLVSNLFFDSADPSEIGVEGVFAADNHLTQEMWLVNPNGETICFDYKYKTISTTDFVPTAAETVPTILIDGKAGSDSTFLMGSSGGVLVEYGLRSKKVEHWDDSKMYYARRNSRPFLTAKSGYQTELVGGLMHFGDAYSEKHLTRYFLGRSSQYQDDHATITVTLSFAQNERDGMTTIGSADIGPDDSLGMIPCHAVGHFFQDTITTSALGNPVRIHQRTFDMKGVSSRSYTRH